MLSIIRMHYMTLLAILKTNHRYAVKISMPCLQLFWYPSARRLMCAALPLMALTSRWLRLLSGNSAGEPESKNSCHLTPESVVSVDDNGNPLFVEPGSVSTSYSPVYLCKNVEVTHPDITCGSCNRTFQMQRLPSLSSVAVFRMRVNLIIF